MAINYEETFGQILRRKRLQLGMGLRELGRASGVCYATIQRMEDDQIQIPDPKKVTALADVLKLDPLFLLSLEDAGVEDKDLRIIARAVHKMNKKQRSQMLKRLRAAFPEAFKNTLSADLDAGSMAVNDEETLGQIIQRKRLQLGMSLRELGRASGVCYVVIMRIEKGEVKLAKPENVKAIADVLHLDRHFLLSLEGAGVEDKDIRIICRAAKKMNQKQRRQMHKLLRGSFPEAFKNTSSDDLDD